MSLASGARLGPYEILRPLGHPMLAPDPLAAQRTPVGSLRGSTGRYGTDGGTADPSVAVAAGRIR